ncbi:MAG: extracellular solute-binding protein, partial [Oscillospiraceae bacterium]
MKKMKRPLSLALCLAVLLSLLALTGCGGGSSSGGSSGGNTEPETPTGTVYVSSFTPIDRSFTNGLSYLIYHDGRFLTASYEMIADNTPEGVTPEWEGQYWEYGYVFYWLSLDGSMEKLENYAPLKVQEMEAVEGGYSDSYTNAICIAQDGSIITLDNVYCSYYDGPEGISQDSEEYWNYYVYEESYYIRHLAQDGTELSCAELTGVTEDENEYFYPYGMVLGDDGDLYVICDDKLLILDTEGKLLYKISTDNYFESIVRLNDGSIAVIHYGESGYELTYVDTENKALGESVELNGNIYRIFTGGGAYDFYYTNGSNFFGYDLESGSATKLFNWINCDVNSDNSDNLAILPDGRVVCVTSDWNDDYSEVSCELVTIEEKPAASVPQKTTLTFATMYLSYDIRDLIIDFNKKNTQYRIEVRDYSEYNTEDDYSAGQTKLTTEILSGNVPDIIDLNGMPTERMAAKGLLQDLYPYLDSDSELSRDDFFANVLAALEIDGALYRTVSTFSISTVIGASSVVGDEPGWTLDEFKAAYARMPEGCTVFNEYVTQSDILSQTLAFEMDSLVNWATGECSFDSDTFKNILAFADSFPSEFDWENWDYNESGGTVSRLQSGRQMLMTANISDFEDPQLYHALFGT